MRYTRRRFLRAAGAGLPVFTLMSHSREDRDRVTQDNRPGRSEPPVESWIEVDLDNLKHNLGRVRERVKVPVLAVIKANAYGHGLEKIGRRLDQLGIAGLMVCRLDEAVRLRRSGVACPIYNFGPFLPGRAACR